MELALYFKTNDRKKKKFRRSSLLKVLKSLAEKYHFRVYPNEKTFALEFFPKAYFYLELVDGGLQGSAAIIHWGPGYHKFLCNFIDILSKQFKVSFLVDDESGYFEDRDFQKLREKYLQKLETHIKACFEEKKPFLAWDSPEWHPFPRPKTFIAPLKRWNYEEVKGVIEKEDFQNFALDFYIWPHAEKDEFFFRNIGLYLLRTEFPWVEPRFPEEESMIIMMLECFQKARELNPEIELPDAEIDGVKKVLSGEEGLKGEGYLSETIIYSLPGDWSIELPGCFVRRQEEDTTVFWSQQRIIRIGDIEIPKEMREISIDEIDDAQEAQGEKVYYAAGDCEYRGNLFFVPDEEMPHYCLDGIVKRGNYLALVVITWLEEEDTDWALSTFRSILNKS
ncbi:MAG TPA: hypothetical protein GX692_03305 [Acholeplasmataceae bacterium]|jgi:hypothetical protein|nr:hypothetical protein [Acholeplasmataceae bacterium]